MNKKIFGSLLLAAFIISPAQAAEHPIKQKALNECVNSGTSRGGNLEAIVKTCVCGFDVYARRVTLKQHIEFDSQPNAAAFERILGQYRGEVQNCIAQLD